MKELYGIKLTRKATLSDKYQLLTPDQKVEFRKQLSEKLGNRPHTTALQSLAQKENYALFVLSSMRSQLHHLEKLGNFPASCRSIRVELMRMDDEIRNTQIARKQERERSNG